MSVIRAWTILTLVLASALLFEECRCQSNPRRRQRPRNPQRRDEGLPSALQEAYMDAVDGQNTPGQSGGNQHEDEPMESESIRSANGWEDLAPSTPASNAVECSVEIYTMRRQGGRCTRLGGHSRPYICQSGQHFAFDPCERIIAARRPVS